MKNFFRKSFAVAIIALPIFGAGSVWAGFCGGGKVTNMNEGDANGNHLLVRIDYKKGESALPGTDLAGYIVFNPDAITQARVDAIRKQIMVAYYTDQPVHIYSHNNSCRDATQVEIIR